MQHSIDIDGQQWQRIEQLARELRVDPAELARAAINDLITRPPNDFERAIQHVLEKNRELYRRLA